jgi:hypothetical protein
VPVDNENKREYLRAWSIEEQSIIASKYQLDLPSEQQLLEELKREIKKTGR